LIDFRFLVVELKEALKQQHRLKGVPGNEDAVAAQEAAIQRLLAKIRDALLPGQEYLGMLRDWIRREKSAQQFVDLEQFGIDLEQLI
jgi:hypothetical protein